jgi:uncharacterized protein YydD (DUF2326 family)
MFLNKLYSEPYGLFEPVTFKDGVNFIFGKKDGASSKESLNGIGKSTILEMIDFCLCSDYTKVSTSRLFKESSKLEGFSIVLEFEINSVEYSIRRSFEKPRTIEIGTTYASEELDIKDAKKELFKLIFEDPKYTGVQSSIWFRSLIAFFLKVHKKSKNEFIDPIQYLTSSNSISELNQFHLYLMGIDNTLVTKNHDLQSGAKDRGAAIREVRRLIEANHSVDIKDANKKVDRLQNEIKKAQNIIESFQLAEQHKNVEEKLNQLTVEIKDLSEENFWDNRKLNTLQESIELKDILSDSKIKGIERLYSEVQGVLGIAVKKSLKEAVEFRKALSKSREEFLYDEIKKLELSVNNRANKIKILDDQRAELFGSLKARNAFNDLTEAYMYIGKLQQDLVDLESKVKTYQDLENAKTKWRGEDAQLTMEMIGFLDTQKAKIEDFRRTFNFVYESIYPTNASSGFSISQSFDTQSKNKLAINISFESEESKGWNKGRTLIYDIAVMMNAIKHDLKRPRFLVHDGIFDGMDKAHFVDLYHFVQKQQTEGSRFQYIVTINEEGTLSQEFGSTDDLTPEKIADEAIVVLTPRHKLWSRSSTN